MGGASVFAGLTNGVFNAAISYIRPAFGTLRTSDWFNAAAMGYVLYYSGITAIRSWAIGLAASGLIGSSLGGVGTGGLR